MEELAPQKPFEAPAINRKAPTGPDPFEQLYRDSRDDVFAYVAFLVGDRSLAEEVTAQAFERAFRKRASYRLERGSMRGWLFRIARNAAVDELRRGNHASALDLVDEAPDDALGVPDAALNRMFVAQAMRKLQPRDRELVALKFFAGLDNAEIARVLRRTKSNVGTQLHRAIERLRAEMSEVDDA